MNVSTSNGKEGKSMTVDSNQIVRIPLSDIHADNAWNARSLVLNAAEALDDKEAPEGADGSTGLAGLMLSLRDKGQDDPVDVRPNPDKKARQPYSLVTGFRRYAAIKASAEKGVLIPGDTGTIKAPTIRAVVRVLSEPEARALNMRENTAREDLSGPDLAWGVFGICKSGPMGDAGASDLAIASMLGKSQGYVSTLHRIMAKIKKSITADWRSSTMPVTVSKMHSLTELPAGEQEKKYDELKKGGKGGTRGPKGWIDTQRKRCGIYGAFLGRAARDGHVTLKGGDKTFAALAVLIVRVTKKQKPTAATFAGWAKATKEAYEKALTAEPEETEEDESGDDE